MRDERFIWKPGDITITKKKDPAVKKANDKKKKDKK